jgi:hypothetical protein
MGWKRKSSRQFDAMAIQKTTEITMVFRVQERNQSEKETGDLEIACGTFDFGDSHPV